MPKARKCREYCEKPAFMDGLCREHLEEKEVKRRLERAAEHALQNGVVDEAPITTPELREQSKRLRDYYWQACNRGSSEWREIKVYNACLDVVNACINAATTFVKAEQAVREGKPLPSGSLDLIDHQIIGVEGLWKIASRLHRR